MVHITTKPVKLFWKIPTTGVKIAEKLKLKCQIEVDMKNENPLLEEVEDNLKGYLVLFKPLE